MLLLFCIQIGSIGQQRVLSDRSLRAFSLSVTLENARVNDISYSILRRIALRRFNQSNKHLTIGPQCNIKRLPDWRMVISHLERACYMISHDSKRGFINFLVSAFEFVPGVCQSVKSAEMDKILDKWSDGRSKRTTSWVKKSAVKKGMIAVGEKVVVTWGKSKKTYSAEVIDGGVHSSENP